MNMVSAPNIGVTNFVHIGREPNRFYVVDGRHRISVASELGYRDLAAWVTGKPGVTGGMLAVAA